MTSPTLTDELAEALETVQWAAADHFRCIECEGQPSTGHTDTCRVGTALTRYNAAKAEDTP